MGFEKLGDFASQILNSSAIKNLSLFEKEESVQAFIEQGEGKLRATLTSPGFFPDVDWQTIKRELLKVIGEQINAVLLPELQNAVYSSIDLSWKAKYKDFNMTENQFVDSLFALSSKLATRSNSRKHYSSVLNFMKHQVILPFLNAAYQNKRYIHNGLQRFDSISYATPEEAAGFLYTGMLLMPLYDVTMPAKAIIPQYAGPAGKSMTFAETDNNSILRQNFLGKIKEILLNEFPGISPYFMDIILKSEYQPEENDASSYSSKMLKIVYHFATQWKKVKKERGAESLEASWLNVARINHKFYAYDLGTLDEFYKITIEEDL